MNVLDLVRPDLRQFSGYLSARKQGGAGDIWLNANESPIQQTFDTQQLNRYPEPQPQQLKHAMCGYYGVDEAQLLISRGSDEGIDVLIRALCEPGKDSIVIQSPTFGMYAVCAKLHACRVIDSPLQKVQQCFEWNIEQLIDDAVQNQAKIVFLCSPANPTGQSLPRAGLEKLLRALQGKCVVVIDEAYGEYSQQPSAIDLLKRYSHLVVLRTLSKAHALAGARIGCVITNPDLIAILKACQAPYPIARPSAELALQAFSEQNLQQTRQQIDSAIAQRNILAEQLRSLPSVQCVFKSQANFLLVEFHDTQAVNTLLLDNGIVVRAMQQYPALQACLRISIGTDFENSRLLNLLTQNSL
jgi:histidinol-phosphate aminotransferase